MVLDGLGEEVEVEVVTPIQDGTFFDADAAAVALVSPGVVGVRLLLRHGEAEEASPYLPDLPDQVRAHPVVHRLEESPGAARVRHGADGGAAFSRAFRQPSQVDHRDVGRGDAFVRRRAFGRRLDVQVWNRRQTAVRQGLDMNNPFWPFLKAVHEDTATPSSRSRDDDNPNNNGITAGELVCLTTTISVIWACVYIDKDGEGELKGE